MFASPLFKCPCKTKPALTVANSRRHPHSLPATDSGQRAVRETRQRNVNISLVQ